MKHLLLLLIAMSAMPASVFAQQAVRVGLHEIPPLAFRDGEGRAQGFCIDVLSELARREGWSLEYVDGSWPECLERLEAGAIDLLFPVFRSPEREALFAFSTEAVISTWGRIFARDADSIQSPEDLEGKVVAVVRGDIFYNQLRTYLDEFDVQCEFQEWATSAEVFASLARRDADAGSVERIDGLQLAVSFGVQATPIVFHPGQAYFVVRPEAGKELLGPIDVHLRQLKTDPKSLYYRSYDRWIGRERVSEFPAWLPGLLLAVCALLILFAAVNSVLTGRVRARTVELSERNVLLEREIRERVHAEEKLRRSEQRLRVSLEAVSEGAWDWDVSTGDVFYSDAWLDSLGYERSEVTADLNFWEGLVHPDDLAKARRLLEEHLDGQTVRYECETRLRTRDGAYRWNLTRGKVVTRGELDEPLRMIAEDADISELKAAERKRRQQEKLSAVGQLAAGIAHEISNPLASISVMVQRVRRRATDPEQREKLDLIVGQIHHIGSNLRQMADLSRPAQTEWIECDLNLVLENALGVVRHDQRAKDVEIALNLDRSVPLYHGMPDLLSQVFVNLALNAFDAMASMNLDRAAVLRVSSVHDADRDLISITFSDSGPGIPVEIRSRLMEPFFTTKEAGKGTGLGLAVSYGIMKEHQGRIRVGESAEGGAEFVLELPRLTEPSPPGVISGA